MPERKPTATSRAGRARKSPAKSLPKIGARAKSGARVKHVAKTARATGKAAARLIDQRIGSLGDWRGETLAAVRRMVHEADPEIVEERKWVKANNPAGVPVWSHAGIVCTGETYKEVVKLTFARGASLPDPRGLFNSSLEGNTRRAIDLREGESLDAQAFKALIQAAVAENLRASGAKGKLPAKSGVKLKSATSEAEATASNEKSGAGKAKPVKLLSGGNPQIAKGDGDAPVQAYIDAMPDWKCDLGRRLDALIARRVPRVRKAVKWNSPFYGVEGQGWFLSFHVFTRYVKVTFFKGTSLRPVPAGGTPKSKETRWIDLHEGEFDEAQMGSWIKQAAALPGWLG